MALNNTNIQLNGTYQYIEEPAQLKTIRIIFFSLVSLLSLLGNTAVIRAIRSGRSRKPLTHYLVTCLAVAELLNSAFLVFVFVYDELYTWIFGSFLCSLVLPSIVVTFGVSTNTLACISIYRYLVIVTPHKKPPSRRVSLGIVAGIWLVSFAVALPLYPLYVHEAHPDYYECYVLEDLRIYDMVRIVLQFFLPVLIMIVSYTVAAVKIKEHMTFMERSRQNRLHSNLSSLNTYLDSQVNGDNNVNLLTVPPHPYNKVVYVPNGHSPHGSVCHINVVPDPQAMENAANKRKSSSPDEGSMIESERDIIKMFYVIVLVFVVCYIPYQVFFLCYFYNVLDRNRHPYYELISKYTTLLISFPSALHPLCYGTMSRFYARAFSKFILCKCKK